jgi:hypothetical protein
VRSQLRLAFAVAFVLALPAVGETFAAAGSQSRPAVSRIIDRTVVCQMPAEGFPDSIRFMTVSAAPRHLPQPGEARSRTDIPPMMGSSNGPSAELRALVRTGADARASTGVVMLSRTSCRPTKLRVHLSARGLRGGVTGRTGNAYKCDVPSMILLRVRAEFERPAGFAPDPNVAGAIVAKGQIATSYLAITARHSRRPVAFASVNDATGRARIFTARSRCTPAEMPPSR